MSLVARASGPILSALIAFNVLGPSPAVAQDQHTTEVAGYFPAMHASTSKRHELCLTFIVDFSNSAMPHGVNGQLQGIKAGMMDHDVMREISNMSGGALVNFVAFSTQYRLMSQAVLQTPKDIEAFANYIGAMERPVNGGNQLLRALELAESTHDALLKDGKSCARTVFDMSGDGADMSFDHSKLREKVLQLAAKGITVHGLSFFDVTMGKYRKPNGAGWIAGDLAKFDDIHAYYRDVIVTPPGAGVTPGMHFRIDNEINSATLSTTIVVAIKEMMRRKVILEIAGTPAEQAKYTRFAGLLPR
ncbi:MAG: DUF1194 domain-containing protein [Proteobacteria bacterium]|nr:DUF1194 domain-containing protein [Pseudomonadota bacterium]